MPAPTPAAGHQAEEADAQELDARERRSDYRLERNMRERDMKAHVRSQLDHLPRLSGGDARGSQTCPRTRVECHGLASCLGLRLALYFIAE